MILHLPMLRIIIPSNVAAFFRVILPIVMFDVLEGFKDTILALFESIDLNFRDESESANSRGMFDQMRSLGYETSNSISNQVREQSSSSFNKIKLTKTEQVYYIRSSFWLFDDILDRFFHSSAIK